MYLHLGQDTVVRTRAVVGVFDLDNTTVSAHTRKYLARAQKDGCVVDVSGELPRTFVLISEGKGAQKRETVYLVQLGTGTIRKRVEKGAAATPKK